MKILQPPDWPRPKGYANGISADGRLIFVAGQIGWDTEGQFPDSFTAQFAQTLHNTLAVLKEGDAGPEHIVRMTWFITDRSAYLASLTDIGACYRDIIGRHYPAMAVVQVAGLMEERALIEIETTAVVPR
ncbi:MAG: RidA family protein [Parvularcula sp.]|jgi:enamine deaminase RidA (YjgF/YER057c/UK114 family)|nr:RidA family protein [Parvularcula sp.]